MGYVEAILERLDDVHCYSWGWSAKCPIHNDSSPSMSLRIGGDGQVLIKCHVCGLGKEFCRKFLQATGLAWADLFPGHEEPLYNFDAKPAYRLTENLDNFYQGISWLAANVGVTAKHKEELRRRGIPEQHIEDAGYFSTELVTEDVLTACSAETGIRLDLMPGVEIDRCRPRLAARAGLFIPVRDVDRRIVSGQVRRDIRPKYIWLRGVGVRCHVPLQSSVHPGGELWVTEGPLKADIATLATGKSVLGAGGVGNWVMTMPNLRRLQPRTVVIAFDADCCHNPHVGAARDAFASACAAEGFTTEIAHWDIGLGKGLDDVAIAGNFKYIQRESQNGKSKQGQGLPAGAGACA